MYFPSTALSYGIELTYECNNACSDCANIWEPQRNKRLQEWKILFDKIAPPENRNKYAELIRITGGEPTLHPEFCEIIEYLDTFGVCHAIFTNGRWTKPDAIIDTFRRCDNFIGLLVSLQGSTAFVHHAFTGSEERGFEETCVSIQRAADAGLEVFTNTVLTKYSCEQIEEIIELSRKLGAEYAVFNRYLGKANPIEPAEEQLRQAIRLIEQLQSEGVSCRIGNCVPPCFTENSSSGANAGIEHCVISPEGLVRPDNLTSFTFGNLFEQSIEEIWRSDKAQWYRSQIPEKCLKCVELPRCRGGARSVAIEHGLEGDRLMKEPIRESQPETLEFDPEWKPIPYFMIREESFGYLLYRYDWSVPVTNDAKPLLDALSGENTLAELHNQFGDAGLELIGHLYKEGCIEFK
jgi:radical SAM protein with 4Fe4S-binding SPASM domain